MREYREYSKLPNCKELGKCIVGLASRSGRHGAWGYTEYWLLYEGDEKAEYVQKFYFCPVCGKKFEENYGVGQ